MQMKDKLIRTPGEMILKIDHKNTSLFYDNETLYSKNIYSKIYNQKTLEVSKKYDLNELNSFDFKGDEFTQNHNGKHIVFTGCSVTWGTGLLNDEVWANKLYKKINEVEKCSGYFNLSFPGTGLAHQVFTLFKYFKEYGNPDYIFYNIPDMCRFYYYNEDVEKIGDAFFSFKDKKGYEILKLISFQYYLMLDQYCKTNDIKLYSFTWTNTIKNNQLLSENTIKDFDTFNNFDIEELDQFIIKYRDLNKNDKYSIIARDNDHFGTAYHEFWSNKAYEWYIKVK